MKRDINYYIPFFHFQKIIYTINNKEKMKFTINTKKANWVEGDSFETYDVELNEIQWSTFKKIKNLMVKDELEAGEVLVKDILDKSKMETETYIKLTTNANLMMALINCAFGMIHTFEYDLKKN